MFFKRKRKVKYKSSSSLLKDPNINKKVSFCISHKNRFSYLQQTMLSNLQDNEQDSDIIEFVVVDFGSDIDVGEWMANEFGEYIRSGYLKYFFTDQLGDWHASLAKNTTHLLANGAILVNLDCDNFTGKNGGKFVHDQFMSRDHGILLWQYSKKKLDGSFGRIAMTRDEFDGLGGYNEALLPMGYQDGDLRNRLISSGLELVHDTNEMYNQAIKNEKFVPKEMSWKKMNEQNQRVSKENIKNNRLVANEGKLYGIRNDILHLDPDALKMKPFLKP